MSSDEAFLLAAILIALCARAGWEVGAWHRRRNEPAPPPTWWVCGSCRSVNEFSPSDPQRCYACGRDLDPATARRLDTAAEFEMVQQFAGSRKGGWDLDLTAMFQERSDDEAPEGIVPTDDDPGRPADPGA